MPNLSMTFHHNATQMLVSRYGLTAVYLFVIQYFTGIGGKVSAKLVKYESNMSTEYRADSVVYKVVTRACFLFCFFFPFDLRCIVIWELISPAGLWSLFHADLHWNFLSCTFAPQHFDPSPSFDSTFNFI